MQKKLLIRSFLILLLSFLTVTSMVVPAEAIVDKSKGATNLKKGDDDKYHSEITLTVPSSETKEIDIVFVFDLSQYALEAMKVVEAKMQEIEKLAEKSSATIKVGAVAFVGYAWAWDAGLIEYDPDSTYGEFENFATEITILTTTNRNLRGTNIHAGLIAADELLQSDTAVRDEDKYIILVSDGITYIWTDEDTKQSLGVSTTQVNDIIYYALPEQWKREHGDAAYIPENGWDAYFEETAAAREKTESEGYVVEYTRDASKLTVGIPYNALENKLGYASTVDFATYHTAQKYRELEGKYNIYPVLSRPDSYNAWGEDFLNYLGGGSTLNIEDIDDEMINRVHTGSLIEDVIGEDFDFENDIKKLSLTLGDKEFEVSEGVADSANETARYLFNYEDINAQNDGEAPFVLHYYENGEDGNSDECYILEINVPVSVFEHLSFTYSLVLVNEESEPGTYGTYDQYGTEGYDGLYTNEFATLYPVDSHGNELEPEEFNRPTVSYTVEETQDDNTKVDEPTKDQKDEDEGTDSTKRVVPNTGAE